MCIVCSEDEEQSALAPAKPHPANPPTRGHLQRIISIEEDHLPHLLHGSGQAHSPLEECSEADEALDSEEDIDLLMSDICPPASAYAAAAGPTTEKTETPTSQRGQPVGKETSVGVSVEISRPHRLTGFGRTLRVACSFDGTSKTFLLNLHAVSQEEGAASPPDRLFKIVLVGNSSVGKTSMLRRFCDDAFHPGTSATVGTHEDGHRRRSAALRSVRCHCPKQ